ncbi:MAG: hypothetical protein GEU86_22400 [Actinophytocola sp.]|nr:hypothetical protein [Actinophytocola sp.]
MLCLPADWPLTQAALQEERTGWPVDVLKRVARLPHEYATWIGEWHSVPNGDPAMPYAPDTPCSRTANQLSWDNVRSVCLIVFGSGLSAWEPSQVDKTESGVVRMTSG